MLIQDAKTHRFLAVNDAALDCYGYSRQEFLALAPGNLSFPDERVPGSEGGSQPQGGKGVLAERHCHRCQDGRILEVRLLARPLAFAGREARLLVAGEVGAPRESEAAMREAELSYRAVADSTCDWVFWISPLGRFLYVSPSCRRHTGYSPAEFQRDPALLERIIHPDDRARYARHVSAKGMEGPLSRLEFRIRHRDGRLRWIGHVCQAVYDEEGRFRGRRASNRDITKAKAGESSLRKAQGQVRHLLARRTAELKDTRRRFAAFMGTSAALAFVKDTRGRYVFASKACAAFHGLQPRRLEGKTDFDLFAKSTAAQLRRQDRALLQAGKTVQQAETLVTADGRTCWWVTCKFLLRSRSGRPFVGNMAVDVTERRRAEEALQYNLRLTQTLINAIPCPVFYKDQAGRYWGCNKAFEELLGMSREQIIGKTVFDIAPREFARLYHRADQELLKRRGTQVYEGPVLDAEGGRHEAIFSKAIFQNAEGKVAGLIGCVLDITRRKRTEEALRESEDRYRRLVAVSPDAILVSRGDRVLFLNEAARRLLGAGRQKQLAGFSLARFLTPEGLQAAHHHLNQAAAGGGSAPTSEARVTRLDGTERTVEIAAAPYLHGGLAALLLVLRDVTERKRLQKEILEVSDSEQRRIGQDLHDGLCQYLSGLKFRIAALEHKLKQKALPEAGEARTVEALASKAIQQARDIARGLHPVNLESQGLVLALRELARTTAEIFGVACPCRCNRVVLVQDHAVATHLYRIAQEAIHNAIKHGRARQVCLSLTASRRGLNLSIRDDGRGFPARARSGLGLHTMSFRARLIGARLEIRRGQPRGTIITCRLPCRRAQSVRRASR